MISNKLALTALAAVSGVLSSRTWAQDPYQAMHKYDSQDRKAAVEIRKLIQEAGADRTKQSLIEASLIPVLTDKDATVLGRQEVAKFLWVIGSGKSVAALAAMLPDPAFNDVARYALERNADASASAALRNALKSTTGSCLLGVINSIGNRGDALALSQLAVLARSKDAIVSEAAINAIGKVGNAEGVGILRSLKPQTELTQNAQLKSAAKIAAEGNGKLSRAIFESLCVNSNPVPIRTGALAGLNAISAPSTLSIALKLAAEASEPTVQRTAGRIAASLPAGTKATLAAFPTLPPAAQIAMLNAYCDRNEVAASNIALTAAGSQDPEMKAAGIRAVSIVCGAGSVPTLLTMAVGGDQSNVARQSLAEMKGAGVEAALLKEAKSGANDRRNTAINVIGNRMTPAATNALLEIASAQDAVSITAIKALTRTGNGQLVSKLIPIMIGTKDESIRDAAQSGIVALVQKSGDNELGVSQLASVFGASNTDGKVAIISAVAELGGDTAFNLITTSAKSPVSEIRSAAYNALANNWTDPKALPGLLDLSKSAPSKGDRISCLRGYFRITAADDRAVNSVRLSRVTDGLAIAERPEEKKQALGVLRNISDMGSVRLAAKYLGDAEVANEAADAIIYLGTSRRRNNREIPGLKGAEIDAALDKIISDVKNDDLQARARKLRNG